VADQEVDGIQNEVAAMRANADQAAATMREQARIMWAYFDGLVDAGFTYDEAMSLVRDWQQLSYE
jgi:hypothetical protein